VKETGNKGNTGIEVNRWLKIRLTVAFALSAVGLITRQIIGFGFTWWQEILLLVVAMPVFLLWWEFFAWIDRKLNEYLPYEKGVGRRIAIQLGVGALILLCFRQTMVYFFADDIGVMLTRIDYVMLVSTDIFGSAAINLGFISYYFINRWKDAQLYDERHRREIAQLQLQHLKNQVNPHFLFNAFSSLDSLIKSDPPLASEFVQHMARVYRYALQHNEKTLVGLDEELSFIRDYIALLGIRYEEGLKITLHLSPEAEDKRIAMVTLQTLIDNALKHNEVHPERPLLIRIFDEEDYLIVENNKQIRRQMTESNQQGLAQLKDLYGLLSERPVLVENSETRFAVKIPLL
jgi:two-component system, LytTR family, sensor kinase